MPSGHTALTMGDIKGTCEEPEHTLPRDLPCVRAQGLEMKSLLLAVLLLGLVAVLKAQDAPLDDQEDVRTGGTAGGGRR